MKEDAQPLQPRVSGEFLVRRKRRRLGAATDPGSGFYVPSSPTSVDANPSSETAEPRSASSENCDISHDPPRCFSPMEVDNQPPPGTRESSGSPTPTPMVTVESFLWKSAAGSRKRQKLKHVDLGNTLHDASPAGQTGERRHPPTITQPLTNTAPRRKRRTRYRSSRVKIIPVKGKAYRARSQKPKAITEDLVRAALTTHVDVDEEFLEDGRKPHSRLDLRTQTNDLTRNTPAKARRRKLVHPSKTQPFPCELSLANSPLSLELGRYPRKPMTAWEGALALSKLDIRMPASTVTPRRKGRPIQGSSPSRARGRYPKLPLTPLSPTPKQTSRGHPVPRDRLHVQRGPPGRKTHPEVTAIPIISAEEVTSPNSERESERDFGSSALNAATLASNRGGLDPSHRDRARVSGSAVINPSRPELQAVSESQKVRFSSPLAPNPENEPDGHPIILVPNSSDTDLARANPDPNNHDSQSPSPPPLPPPRLLLVQSRPSSLERTLDYRTSAVDSDGERDPGGTDASAPPITVSTQSKTSDNNGDVVPGGLQLNDVMGMKRRQEAEHVDQNQFGANPSFSSQDPAETPLGNVLNCIGPQGVHPHDAGNVRDPDTQQGDGVRHSPLASKPADFFDSIEHSKPIKPLVSSFDRLTVNTPRVESGARSKLQAEVEGDEEHDEVIGPSKQVTNSNGPPHSTSFPPLGRMLSLLDEAGPSRSLGGFGRTITKRPRRPIARRRSSKQFQTQPTAEVENGWQSEGNFNVNARSGAGFSKSDDLSFFAGL